MYTVMQENWARWGAGERVELMTDWPKYHTEPKNDADVNTTILTPHLILDGRGFLNVPKWN